MFYIITFQDVYSFHEKHIECFNVLPCWIITHTAINNKIINNNKMARNL